MDVLLLYQSMSSAKDQENVRKFVDVILKGRVRELEIEIKATNQFMALTGPSRKFFRDSKLPLSLTEAQVDRGSAARANFSERTCGINGHLFYEAESQLLGVPIQAVTLLQPLAN